MPILVYRVTPQKISGLNGPIDVTQFDAQLKSIQNTWAKRPDGGRDGLVLFSGDVFSPSVESSVTRGSHMVPVEQMFTISMQNPRLYELHRS